MSRKCGVEKLQLTEYELMYNDLFVDCSDHFFQSWRTKSGCGIPTLDAEVYVALFDLDLWPTTLTYNPRLAKVNIDPHAKNQDQKSNGSNRRATDKWTDTHTRTHTDATKRVISPATRSINILWYGKCGAALCRQ